MEGYFDVEDYVEQQAKIGHDGEPISFEPSETEEG